MGASKYDPNTGFFLTLVMLLGFQNCSQVSLVGSVNGSASSQSQSGNFAGSVNIPNPPSSAILVSQIQQLSNWSSSTGAASQCPNGVASPTCNPVNANYNATVGHPADPLVLPGSSGTSGEFQIYQSPANATVVWGQALQTHSTATNFIWDFYVYVTGAHYASSELDLYATLNGGQRFMMGSQCNRGNNSWDTWNEASQTWIHNMNVPCNSVLSPGLWHRVSFYNSIDLASNTYTYRVLRIDGVDYILNQTQPAQHMNWPDGLLGVQVQLDADSSGQAVDEYFENMQTYSW